jgi:hypothetical protein
MSSVCVCLKVRGELLTCITAVHAGLRSQLEAADVRLLITWLERYARYPFGAGEATALHCIALHCLCVCVQALLEKYTHAAHRPA